jgi:L-rhamnose mutarotase
MRDRYTELHDAVWESVLQRMSLSNIRNFTIYFHEETSTLFCHYEWIGHWGKGPLTADEEAALLKADLEAIAQDPMTKLWWTECEPCQEPFSQWDSQQTPPSQGGVGDWWAPLVCVTQCGHWPDNYAAELRDPDFVKQNPYGKTTIQPTVGV